MGPRAGSFLDTVWARLVAGLVAVAFIALIVWIDRDALTGPAAPAGPLAACLSERGGQVDAMVAEGVISQAQADEFRIRARQLCRQTVPAD